MQKQPAFLSVFLILALEMQAVAKTNDSLLIRNRLDNNYHSGHIVWDATHKFYLAEKLSDTKESSIPLLRLDDRWQIIRFDPKLTYTLTNIYQTIVPANNNWKYAASLQAKLVEKKFPLYPLLLRISFLHNESKAVAANAFLQAITLKEYPGYNCADVFVKDKQTLLQLENDTNIVAISIVHSRVYKEQAIEGLDLSTNYINTVHDKMPGINGNGTTVCIKEDLFDTTDIDFKNRYFLTSYSSSDIDNHAGIVATMAGGSGNSYHTGKGAAWKTRLTSASFNNLMPEPLAYYQQYKINAQNHSYGTSIENEYAADAAAYDLTTWIDTSLLNVFSAGNSGTATSFTGKYAGIANYANITGSFKMSKNGLVVGGTDSFYHIQTLSSKGPAYDGRIKPELVAFGLDGTSGAAALTSGVALLLQQQLQQLRGATPSVALVKALLITGSDDINNEGPEFANGYGSVNAYRSLNIANGNTYLTAFINEGETHQQKIFVPSNTALFKITLAWTDTPASPLSASAIMNDLDVELRMPDGSIIKPWVLSSVANADSLQRAAVRGTDSLNTVEVISLLNPAAGDYIVHIKAKKLYTTSQAYAAAWFTEAADTLTVTSPTTTSACFANSLQTVRWQSSFSNNATGTLEYKYAGTNDWKHITETLPLSQQWYQWQTPDATAKTLLRITVGTKVFTSDTFVVSKPTELKVGYNCSDSVYLYWNKQEVNDYYIYNLGDTLLEPIAAVTDTFFQTATKFLNSNYVAVAPIVDGREATRSVTIDIAQQGVGCYITNFLADLLDDSVRLTLTVGTNHNINKIVLQKLVNGAFTDINFTLPKQTLTYYFIDKQLYRGGNSYRIQIILNDGQVLYTPVETIYYLEKKLYLLYPNPVKRGQPLSILNRFSDGDLYASLYDITGRLIRKLDLTNASNTVGTSPLSTGVYLLVFNDGSKKLGIEKLVVQ